MGFDFGKELVTGVKRRVLKKVIGGVGDAIRGIPSVGRLDDLKGFGNRNYGNSTKTFKFPLDVDTSPGLGNQGHYIMFYINEQENVQLTFGNPAKDGTKSVLSEQGKRGISNVTKKVLTRAGGTSIDDVKYERQLDFENKQKLIHAEAEDFIKSFKKLDNGYYNEELGQFADSKEQLIKRYARQKGPKKRDYAVLNVKRSPTRRLDTAIALYMPNDISVKYGAGYKDQEIGTLAEDVLNVYELTGNRNFGAAGMAIVNMDEGVKQLLAALLTTTVGVLPGMGGFEELIAIREGKVFSNRMEVAFTGLEKRTFNYTFKMIPRNQREAEEIRAIIFAFKRNMLPELDGDFTKGRRLVIPNTFDIMYMYNGQENEYLHKISTCVLQDLTVKYGGQKFETFRGTAEGAPVVETEISLNFKEMETITRERIDEGF